MRCPACMRYVGLSGKRCTCGLDLATRDPTRAREVVARDRLKALRLLLLGGCAIAAIVAVDVIPVLGAAWTRWSAPPGDGLPVRVMRVSTAVLIVTVMTAIYAPIRGAWIAYDARRRSRRLHEIDVLPSARVIAS